MPGISDLSSCRSCWATVTVLDALIHAQNSLLECCSNTKFDFIKGDISDQDLMAQLIGKFDIIIPLAAIVGAPACKINPTLTRLVNYDAYMKLIKTLSPSQMVIFPTTNSGYGVGEKDVFCTEESPLRPISEYGKTKVEVERGYLSPGNCFRHESENEDGSSC